jgi:hypothetical protein
VAVSRAFQKIILQRQLSDLGVQRLHIDNRLGCRIAAAGIKNVGSTALKLCLPRCDLVGVSVELLPS